MIYGYTRVSSEGQAKNGNSLEDQEAVILGKYPDALIVPEVYSGAKERPVFSQLVSTAQAGDLVVVTKLDRFCRTTKEGLDYIDTLMKKGVSIHILNMGLVEDTPMGRLIVTNLLAFAEFERAMILERTAAGKRVARLDPNYKEGRPAATVDPALFNDLLEKNRAGEVSSVDAAKILNISRSTWYRMLAERARAAE